MTVLFHLNALLRKLLLYWISTDQISMPLSNTFKEIPPLFHHASSEAGKNFLLFFLFLVLFVLLFACLFVVRLDNNSILIAVSQYYSCGPLLFPQVLAHVHM